MEDQALKLTLKNKCFDALVPSETTVTTKK